MKKSKAQAALQLSDYVVDLLTVESNANFRPSKERTPKSEGVELEFRFRRRKELPQFMVEMKVWINRSRKAFLSSPYRIGIGLRTLLSFPPSVKEGEIRQLLGPNGLAMTYSIARGIVGQVTANCPWGKFVLPSLNFVELLKQKAHEKKKSDRRVRSKGSQ